MRSISSLFDIPNSWRKVPVKRFTKILQVDAQGLDAVVAYLAALTSETRANEFPLKKLGRLSNRLRFLNSVPVSRPYRSFWFKGVYYVARPFNELTVAEYVDLELALIEHPGADAIPYLLGILFRPIHQRRYNGSKAALRGVKFQELSVHKAYGPFQSFIQWREDLLTKRFGVLFNQSDEDKQDEEPQIHRGGRRFAEVQRQIALRKQRWNWYGLVHRLAGGDIRKMEQIERLPIIQAFVHLAYEAQKDDQMSS